MLGPRAPSSCDKRRTSGPKTKRIGPFGDDLRPSTIRAKTIPGPRFAVPRTSRAASANRSGSAFEHSRGRRPIIATSARGPQSGVVRGPHSHDGAHVLGRVHRVDLAGAGLSRHHGPASGLAPGASSGRFGLRLRDRAGRFGPDVPERRGGSVGASVRVCNERTQRRGASRRQAQIFPKPLAQIGGQGRGRGNSRSRSRLLDPDRAGQIRPGRRRAGISRRRERPHRSHRCRARRTGRRTANAVVDRFGIDSGVRDRTGVSRYRTLCPRFIRDFGACDESGPDRGNGCRRSHGPRRRCRLYRPTG